MNAGFGRSSKEKLYIRQDESKDRPTVKKQQADKNSLYHEIRKLIEIRQSHKALQSKGEIEFVFARKEAYPFAYLRSSGEEKILVVLNPSDQNADFEYDLKSAKTIYSFGGEVTLQDGRITAPACSANYILLQ